MKKQFFILVLVTLSVTSYGQDYDAQITQKQNELNSIDEQISQKQNQFILANSAYESESAKYKLAESKMKKANDLYNKGAQNTDIVSPEQLSKLLSDLQQSKKELSEVELTFKQSEVAKVSLNNEINSLKKQRTQKEIEVYEVQARQFDEGIKQTVWVEGFGESIMDENKTLKQAQDLALVYAKTDAIQKGGRALMAYIQKSNPSGNPSKPISTETSTSDNVQIVEQDQSGDYGKVQRIMQGDIIKFTAKVRMKVQSVATYNPYREKIRQLKGLASTESSQQIENTISSNGSLILSDGLIAYYPFNGNANDESGNNNNGRISNTTLTSDRNSNNNSAYYFNGKTSYITLPELNISESFTITVWVKPENSYSDIPTIFAKWNSSNNSRSITIEFYRNNLNFAICDDVNQTNGDFQSFFATHPPINTWTFLAFSYNASSGTRKIYVNSTMVNERKTNSNRISSNNATTYLGTKEFANMCFYKGTMDEVRIYNRVLSQNEITALYRE